jgi:hypothetical protein
LAKRLCPAATNSRPADKNSECYQQQPPICQVIKRNQGGHFNLFLLRLLLLLSDLLQVVRIIIAPYFTTNNTTTDQLDGLPALEIQTPNKLSLRPCCLLTLILYDIIVTSFNPMNERSPNF